MNENTKLGIRTAASIYVLGFMAASFSICMLSPLPFNTSLSVADITNLRIYSTKKSSIIRILILIFFLARPVSSLFFLPQTQKRTYETKDATASMRLPINVESDISIPGIGSMISFVITGIMLQIIMITVRTRVVINPPRGKLSSLFLAIIIPSMTPHAGYII